MSRTEYIDYSSTLEVEPRQIAFISLQDLKGARFAGGEYDKLEWVGQLNWDLLVIDEAHEGVDTYKTDKAFEKINRNFTLHLSGTPFKAIANNKFRPDQIYNWSYLDEQLAKNNWDSSSEESNPYEQLPELSLFTYQMSKIIEDAVSQGVSIQNELNKDFAFDLNEFFRADDNGRFEYENDVIKFLDNLTEGKFPFSSSEYKKELDHTFWLLPRVNSCKALEKLLVKHPVFKDYKIILAAGDGASIIDEEDVKYKESELTNYKSNEKSFDRVTRAIRENDKTITLSVGQLTTGVTIPEWTGILMLNNIMSPSLYFQAAFRVQNPFEKQVNGKLYRKERAYIFDFAPERTLQLFSEFAYKLNGNEYNFSNDEKKKYIRNLLNFFPVIAEDKDGSMIELNTQDILTIPNKIKSAEVVKRGFMSNLLFANIGRIFNAPQEIKDILSKINPEKQGRLDKKRDLIDTKPLVDKQGEVSVPDEFVINTTGKLFGEKIFSNTKINLSIDLDVMKTVKNFEKQMETNLEAEEDKLRWNSSEIKAVKESFKENLEVKIQEQKDNLKKTIEEVDKELEWYATNTKAQSQIKLAEAKNDEEFDQILEEAERIIEEAKIRSEIKKAEAEKAFQEKVLEEAKTVAQEAVSKQVFKQEEKKKKETETDVRDHLRGFARAIPAFLMAYGDENTTLSNFERNIEPETFKDLTSITIDEFLMLRDGFTYESETGEQLTFEGFFDEGVFNASIKEFFNKKRELANYFDEDLEEDIFDYIPNQKTNQIFTPKNVVKMMVDKLEEENPDIFTNPNTTFIDLYVKSGLFFTEIVKKLNLGLINTIQNREQRIKHILEKQVFGLAPTNIIYNIAKNYIFGEIPDVKSDNLIQLDLTPYSKNKEIKNILNKYFGGIDMKFDVVIGNPPFNTGTKKQLYPDFYLSSIQLADWVCLIFPTGWQEPKNNNGLEKLNKPEIKQDCQIVQIDNIHQAFPSVAGAEWTNILLWRRGYDNGLNGMQKVLENGRNEQKVKLLLDKSEIIKPYEIEEFSRIVTNFKNFKSIKNITTARKPYGLPTDFIKKHKDEYFISLVKKDDKDIKMYTTKEVYYLPHNFKLPKKAPAYDSYKVFVPDAWGNMSPLNGYLGGSYASIIVASPKEIAIGSYIETGNFDTKSSAIKHAKYFMTKFFRGLLFANKNSIINSTAWGSIPMQDYTEDFWDNSIEEIDNKLFEKYNIPNYIKTFVENNIQPRDESYIINI